jgi:hypothetical protein
MESSDGCVFGETLPSMVVFVVGKTGAAALNSGVVSVATSAESAFLGSMVEVMLMGLFRLGRLKAGEVGSWL